MDLGEGGVCALNKDGDQGDDDLRESSFSLRDGCCGILLFVVALLLLGLNENNFVCTKRRIVYADKHASVASCDRRILSQDSFAFFSCPLVPSSLKRFELCTFNRVPCGDELLDFTSVSGKQVAEMYVCAETCETELVDNETSGGREEVRNCTYRMEWSRSPGGREFERNATEVSEGCKDFEAAGGNPLPPTELNVGSTAKFAEKVLAGDSEEVAYTLNSKLVEQLDPRTQIDLRAYASNFTGQAMSPMNWSRPFSFSPDAWMVSENYLVSCATPRIGCIRISFYKSFAETPSVIAHVAKGTGLTSPEAIAGSWGCGASAWQVIFPDPHSKPEVIELLQEQNTTQAWLLRFIGLFMAWLGIYICLAPMAAFTTSAANAVIGFVPCFHGYLQSTVRAMAKCLLCTVSCSLGCSSGLFVIAVVWLFMRPLAAGAMLAALLLFCGIVGKFGQLHMDKQRQKAPQEVEITSPYARI